MPRTSLKDRTVAFVVTDGYEDSELRRPWDALRGAGAGTVLVSPRADEVTGVHGDRQPVDVLVADARADDYDALVIPGGVQNADRLRMDRDAVAFARAFFEQHKPVGAICHGPWLLVEADVVKGRTMTSYPSLATDLRNAGAAWIDERVVTDQGLVTSRRPDDLEAFDEKLIEEVAEGAHAQQTT